jgi:hypothetical protein
MVVRAEPLLQGPGISNDPVSHEERLASGDTYPMVPGIFNRKKDFVRRGI